jgi:hypothetical protein
VVAKSIAYIAAFNEELEPSIGTKIFEYLILFVLELDNQIHLNNKKSIAINILQVSLFDYMILKQPLS